MSRPRDSVIWGAILVIIGASFLVWNLGMLAGFQVTATWILVAFFALLGLAFLFSYLNKRADWWRLIPAFTLLAVAAVIYLSARNVATIWVAAVLLASIALAFVVIYASDREERWWALIPFGSMAVMMAVVVLSALPQADILLLGAVLFGGMSLVFFLIYALAPDHHRFGWALVPTAVLGIMALVALTAYAPTAVPGLSRIAQLWPILVMLFGAALLTYAAVKSGRGAPPAIEPQPAASDIPLAPPAGKEEPQTEEESAARPTRYERSPITLVDETPATNTSGEVDDLYEFLKNAPAENNS